MGSADDATRGQPPAVAHTGDVHEAPTLLVNPSARPAPAQPPAAGIDDPEATIIVDDRVPACALIGRESTVIVAAPGGGAAAGVDHGAPTVLLAGGAPGAATAKAPQEPAGPLPPSMPASVRAGIARYVVVGEVGKGGMGVVHVAQDVDLLRRVALKELTPSAAHDRDARSRFVREVQVTAQLDHPHIVPVYGLEVAPGDVPAYAMKLVEGRTFADLVAETRTCYEQGRSPDDDHALHARLEHFLKVCDAVEYAHERGVVHRDLKPANLMLGAHNEVYVMDWGLCRLVAAAAPSAVASHGEPAGDGDGAQTSSGTIVGTPRYMSPEQARGENDRLDARSDQYSLGLILLELVTLRPPIAGANVMEILGHAAQGVRARVEHRHGVAIAPELTAIVEKSTSLDPASRYASVGAMADDIRRFMRGEAVEARPDTAWQRLVRRAARHRQAAALSVLAFVVLSLATVVGLLLRHERALAREDREQAQLQLLMRDVSARADSLQAGLMDVRADLIALAAAVAQAAEFGEPDTRPVPWAGSPQAAAAGVFTRPPGADDPALEAMARRLMRADTARQRLLAGLHTSFGTPRAGGRILVEMRAGFANGLGYHQPAGAPGAHATPVDPRTLAWYRAGATSTDVGWSALADDGDADVNDGAVAIAAPVKGASDDDVLGVVGLVLALSDVLHGVVADVPLPAAAEIALVDRGGRVLALHRPGTDAHAVRVSPTLGAPDVLRAVSSDYGGVVEIDAGEGPRVVVFDRLYPTEWALVVVAPADRVYFD